MRKLGAVSSPFLATTPYSTAPAPDRGYIGQSRNHSFYRTRVIPSSKQMMARSAQFQQLRGNNISMVIGALLLLNRH